MGILKEELYLNDQYNINNNTDSNSQNNGWQTPKEKKKKNGAGFLKVIALALICGLLAGACASGYHYFLRGGRDNQKAANLSKEEKQKENDTSKGVSDEKVLATTNTETEGIITDVSDVVEKVMPSIVSINSTDIITKYDIFFGRQFNEPVVGSGSGIIIGQSDSAILIVTNNHVIAEAEEIEIVFVDESKAQATVKGSDARSDLAILEVRINDLSKETLNTIKVARLGDSTKLKAGEMVIAIGNALGYGQSVTVGYVSALDREIEIQGIKMKLLQTDTAINPGNSGGALININGEVIGINSVKFEDILVEGMGYAIPISNAIPMINLLMNNKVREVAEMGFLGINLESAQDVTKDLAEQFNMPMGIYINDVIKDSPAEKAGLKSRHIIVGYDDLKIETIDDLINILTYSRPGDEITLKVKERQDGEYVDKELISVLGERP